MSLDAVYITYWSLRDPLCLSQSLPVLRALASDGRRLGLITFEQPPWAMPPTERDRQVRELAAEGIRWIPLRYHKRPAVFSTLFDVGVGVLRCLRLNREEKVLLFHARGSVPSAIAYTASRLAGTRFLNDADGPLSQEYVDAGVWSAGSLPHRLTGWSERRFLRAADAVAVLTERRRIEVTGQVPGNIVVLPCAVDTSLFTGDAVVREATRRELGLSGTVLVYAGKAGGWYLTDAMLDFAKVAAEAFGDVSLLVLTTQDSRRFTDPAEARGLRCVARAATRDEMPRYLAAGDAGLSLVLPTPSKEACSPVKNGEYLACGLPIVTTPRIGDYSDLVVRRRVGVVVGTLDADGYRRAAVELRQLLADPSLRARCRQSAEAEVGLSQVVIPRYREVYARLLGPKEGIHA